MERPRRAPTENFPPSNRIGAGGVSRDGDLSHAYCSTHANKRKVLVLLPTICIVPEPPVLLFWGQGSKRHPASVAALATPSNSPPAQGTLFSIAAYVGALYSSSPCYCSIELNAAPSLKIFHLPQPPVLFSIEPVPDVYALLFL
jgi:hypothetical protein